MFKLIEFFGVDILWKWLKPTFEGDDGKASSKKLTTYVIVVLFILGHIQVYYVINNIQLIEHTLNLDALMLSVLIGIFTVQNVFTFMKLRNGNNNPKS